MADETKKTVLKQTGIEVKLIGEDGNAFFILGKVCQALRLGGYRQEFIDTYLKEAKSSDYYHLLAVTMDVVVVR